MADRKTCFVVMGFGKKTDLATGRVLDLDKSYRNIIKPAVTEAGLTCLRADEIIHSGIIDVPMYEQLLKADVVVADLSTANNNAFYELGVRHALRPYTTITIAEEKLTVPFDANHVLVRSYKHLGEGIDFDEVMRMRDVLKQAVEAIAAKPACDSPVYTFVKDLRPPELRAAVAAAAEAEAVAAGNPADDAAKQTVSMLVGQAEAAMKRSDFMTARSLLSAVRSMMPLEPYYVQQLALATYKSKFPTAVQALDEAKAILATLDPSVSTDGETLGLWGAIHKRLWEETRDQTHLDTAIDAYEKGFYLKNDYYNGINLAFLFNVRAAQTPGSDEAIADVVTARRKRRRVLDICEPLKESAKGDAKYWVLATMAEAWFGLGERARANDVLAEAFALEPAPTQWMKDSTTEQLAKLEKLLA